MAAIPLDQAGDDLLLSAWFEQLFDFVDQFRLQCFQPWTAACGEQQFAQVAITGNDRLTAFDKALMVEPEGMGEQHGRGAAQHVAQRFFGHRILVVAVAEGVLVPLSPHDAQQPSLIVLQRRGQADLLVMKSVGFFGLRGNAEQQVAQGG